MLPYLKIKKTGASHLLIPTMSGANGGGNRLLGTLSIITPQSIPLKVQENKGEEE